MSLTTREANIYNRVEELTVQFLLDFDFDSLESDAFNISIDLDIDRPNTSRTLNKLHRENKLIKIQGRPTLFLVREYISNAYPNAYFSSLITDRESFVSSLTGENVDLNNRFATRKLEQVIGSNENESLFEQSNTLNTFVNYPNHLYSLLVIGNPSTGKKAIVDFAHNRGVETGKYANQIIEINALEFSENFDTVNKAVKYISAINNSNKTTLIVVKQVLRIEPRILAYLLSQLRSIQRDPNQSPKQFVYLEDEFNNTEQNIILDQYVTNTIKIPNLNDRTIKEKVDFILSFLQNEANAIKKTIYVDKNIFSCFAMSSYPNNFKHLENEIRFAVSNALYNSSTKDTNVLDMKFDDLSDSLLNNITNDPRQMSNLNKIFKFIEQNDFYFIPNIPSKELLALRNGVLDYESNIIEGSSYLTPLSTYVKKQIELSLKVEDSKIETLYIRDIHNSLYPMIEESFSYPDKVIFQLFVHLETVIQNVRRDNYKQLYYKDSEYVKPDIIALSQKIKSTIEMDYKITLPDIELEYIQSYLSNSRFNSKDSNIPLLLVSQSLEIANSYQKYIDSLNLKVEIDTLGHQNSVAKDYTNIFISQLEKKVSKLDQGSGVVILTDVSSFTSIMNEVFKESDHEVVIIPTLSLDILAKAATIAESVDSTVDDFIILTRSLGASALYNENKNDVSGNFIHDISIRILSESLVFLDVQKSTALLSSVLMDIYKSLDFEYSESLSVRFIHHTSFMIERVIKNEPLAYKNVTQFISQYPDIYNIVEKNFQIINNQFGISIPQSELVMVSEIFASVIK